MEIELRMRGGRRADWLPLLRERLLQALRRFKDRVTRVRVSLDDVNGPRGGQDKRCTLVLSTRDGRQLHLSEQTDRWATAFAWALDRAALSMRKLHDRDADRALSHPRRQRAQAKDSQDTGDFDAQLSR